MAEENWIWIAIKKLSGSCAAASDFNDIKAIVGDAQGKIDDALKVGDFLQQDSQVFDKLTKANEGLGNIKKSMDKVSDICLDVQAINKIHDSIVILNEANVIQANPQRAANAFDNLFQGFGRLCRFLPPPADQWGQFFESFNLFGNVQKNIYKPYFDRLEKARMGNPDY
ncbi:MAG: hypothetical protein HKN33_19200 [Pyrinomonadaceae bacterium]|nr:hypothetical protein [Pyrinomonadaceae bacterium]